MKRLLCYLTLITALVLNTGCEKSSAVTAVTTGLSFSAEITCEDYSAFIDAAINKNGNAEFTVTAPEKASGLKFKYTSHCVLSYDGLEYPIKGEFPEFGFINTVYEIFESAEKSKHKVTKTSQGFILKGKTDKTDYEMLLGESGLPIKITTDNKMTVVIKNATLKD